jgi:hypothetical protein
MHVENRALRAANEALSKRWRAKKQQIHAEQALVIEDAIDTIA